jgi:hypothetical protein
LPLGVAFAVLAICASCIDRINHTGLTGYFVFIGLGGAIKATCPVWPAMSVVRGKPEVALRGR